MSGFQSLPLDMLTFSLYKEKVSMSESGRRRGEATREVILTAAEIVFAEHGFDGARVDTIANVSGYVNKLIFRYFGDNLGPSAEGLPLTDRELNALLARTIAPSL